RRRARARRRALAWRAGGHRRRRDRTPRAVHRPARGRARARSRCGRLCVRPARDARGGEGDVRLALRRRAASARDRHGVRLRSVFRVRRAEAGRGLPARVRRWPGDRRSCAGARARGRGGASVSAADGATRAPGSGRARADERAAPGAREGAGTVEFCGLRLAHRVINGSGTFDVLAARAVFGAALDERFPFAAYVSKTITLEPRAGNPPPRLWEAAQGLINSIGLPNKGLEAYMAEDVPALADLSTTVPAGTDAGERAAVPLITNVMGSTAEELVELVDACHERSEISAVE